MYCFCFDASAPEKSLHPSLLNISRTPWGNFWKSECLRHMNWLDFGGWRSTSLQHLDILQKLFWPLFNAAVQEEQLFWFYTRTSTISSFPPGPQFRSLWCNRFRFLCLTSSELWSRPPAHICQPEAAGAAGGAAAGGNTDCDGEQSGQTGQRQNCRWNIWTSSWSVCFLSIRTNLTNNLMNVQRLSDSKPHQDVLVFQIWYFHSYVSRKADWRLLFSCKEESFQSPEQKTQPGEYSSSLLNMIKGFLFECHAENASCVIIFCVKVPKSDEEYDLRVPRDMAYIFSGAYVPLSCRLIEQVSELFIPQDRTLSCW